MDALRHELSPPTLDALQVLLSSLPDGAEVAVLTLSGALSPVHVGHVQCLSVAAVALSSAGRTPVLGLLAPSSDQYLSYKLKDEALPLSSRVQLCEAACAEASFVDVALPIGALGWGQASSSTVSTWARQLLAAAFPRLTWVGVQVVGSDFAVKQRLDERAGSRMQFVCLRREGDEFDHTVLSEGNPHFVLAPLGAVQTVSSTAVREFARDGDWDRLEASGFLHAPVCAQLRAMRWLQQGWREELRAAQEAASEQAMGSATPPPGGTQPATSAPTCDARTPHAAQWRPFGWLSQRWAAAQQRRAEAAEWAAFARSCTPLLVGISGASRCGKSTLTQALAEHLARRGMRTATLCQDHYFNRAAVTEAALKNGGMGNFEVPEAIHHDRFANDALAVCAGAHLRLHNGVPAYRAERSTRDGLRVELLDGASAPVRVVLAEGFQAFHDPRLRGSLTLRLWLDVSKEEARRRRMATAPCPPSYFEQCVWAEHVAYRERALAGGGVTILSGEQPQATILAAAIEYVMCALRETAAAKPVRQDAAAAAAAAAAGKTVTGTAPAARSAATGEAPFLRSNKAPQDRIHSQRASER